MKCGLIVLSILPLGLSASPVACPVGTALDYVAFGSSGCLDGKGTLLSNFQFSTNPAFPVPLGSVQVSPTAPDVTSEFSFISYASGLTLTFSPPFNPAPSQEVDLRIGLTISHTPPAPGTIVAYAMVPTFFPDVNSLGFQNGTATVTAGGMTEVIDAGGIAEAIGVGVNPSIETN